MKCLPIAVGAAAMLLGPPRAQGTNFAVLLTPGMTGESTLRGFAGGIDIAGFSLDGPLASGVPGGFWLRKRIDKSSPLLFRHCARGKHFPKAELFLLDPPLPDTGTQAVFCKITMTDLLVSSYRCSAELPDAPPEESFRLAFGRVFFDYRSGDGSVVTAYLALARSGPDTDGDGMGDGFEEYFGLDPLLDNKDSDSDGDGLSDKDEARLGFNPVAPESFFRCGVAPVPGTDGLIEITWDAVPDTDYVVEWTPDLGQPFKPLLTVRATDLRAGHAQLRQDLAGFFRVRPAAD